MKENIVIRYKEFEEIYKKNSKLDIVNDFLNSINNCNLISIEENIFFNKEKIRYSRIIIYYNLTNQNENKYNIFRINIKSSKENLKDNLEILNKFIEKNNQLELFSTSSNHFIEDKKLQIRISYFFISS